MAEVTGLRSNALNYPAYAAPYGVTFPILDADGDLVTGAAGLDSEISKNGDTFADCTNEATEIATASGMYYLLLTATELTTDTATIIVKTSTVGAKTTPIVLYPRKLVTLRSGTAAGGAAGSITLDSGASAVDDFYNGCLVVGTLDSTVEARIITDYNGSTKVASVTPDWVTTPDSDDTFIVYLPEGIQVNQANVSVWNGTVVATPATAGIPDVNAKNINNIATTSVTTVSANLGTTQPVNFTGTGASALAKSDVVDIAGSAVTAAAGIPEVKVASIASAAITAASIASDAITDAKVAADVTIASVTGAVGSVTSRVTANTDQLAGQAVTAAAGVTFPTSVASPTNITAGTMTTTTNLTNLPSIPANWITAAGITDGALTAAKFASGAFDAVWTVATRTLTSFGTVAADVWASVTRTLTAGTNIVLAKGVGVTGFNDLSAAQVNAEADTALTDYDGPTNAELATALATADDAVLAAIAALNNLSTAQVTAAVPTALQNADAYLKRDMSAVTGEAARSPLNAHRFQRNRWQIAGGILTVYKEDDTSVAWTAPVTQTPGDPVSEIDPA